MANISTYLEEILLNLVMRATAYPGGAPAAVYCGLVSDVAVDDDLEGNDLTDEITGYTGFRKEITFSAPADVGGKATIKNNDGVGGGELEFLDMPAPAGRTVKYAVVVDASGDPAWAGNVLYWCPITGGPKAWNEGDTFRIPIDGLVLDLA